MMGTPGGPSEKSAASSPLSTGRRISAQRFAAELRNVAAHDRRRTGDAVYFVSLGSFDTHVNQQGRTSSSSRCWATG